MEDDCTTPRKKRDARDIVATQNPMLRGHFSANTPLKPSAEGTSGIFTCRSVGSSEKKIRSRHAFLHTQMYGF